VTKELPGLIGSGPAPAPVPPADPALPAALQTLTTSVSNLVAAASAGGGTSVSPPAPPLESPLSVTPTSLSFASAQHASDQLLVSGGEAPYTMAVEGTLPGGIGFDKTTNSFAGVPSDPTGTPYSFDVVVTDSTTPVPNTVTQAYSGEIG